jgi:hypothetical protein
MIIKTICPTSTRDNITTYAISIHFTLQQAPPNPKIVKINRNSPERINARGIDPTKSDKLKSRLTLEYPASDSDFSKLSMTG